MAMSDVEERRSLKITLGSVEAREWEIDGTLDAAQNVLFLRQV
jgi:hypothetical protein